MSEDKRLGKYWICAECAAKKDLHPFKTGNTMTLGLCSWCDSPAESFLTPLRDLKTKEDKRADCVVDL